jgi:hypothetical protein
MLSLDLSEFCVLYLQVEVLPAAGLANSLHRVQAYPDYGSGVGGWREAMFLACNALAGLGIGAAEKGKDPSFYQWLSPGLLMARCSSALFLSRACGPGSSSPHFSNSFGQIYLSAFSTVLFFRSLTTRVHYKYVLFSCPRYLETLLVLVVLLLGD